MRHPPAELDQHHNRTGAHGQYLLAAFQMPGLASAHVRARARASLIGAGAGAVFLTLTWLAAFHTALGEHADRAVLPGFVGLQRPHVNALANLIAHICDPKPFVALAGLLVLLALLRGRPRIALAIAAILICANETTELIKPLVSTPRLLPGNPIPERSWPSGHATAAMSLALCAILVAPGRLRPIVAVIGSAFAVAVSYSFLTLAWHYPSDVVGGFLVAGTWALLGVAALSWSEAQRENGPVTEDSTRPSLRTALIAPAASCGAAAALAGLVLLVRPHQVLDYAGSHEAFVIGAAAIGLLGLAVATALMVGVRR
jgi:membrane-associated phospholipid phosphatase